MRLFKLPDLGEGLTEAEIVEWHVAAGERVEQDQPLVSLETDKAVVEVPSPYAARILRLYGESGHRVETGDPLVEFDLPADQKRKAESLVGEVPSGDRVMEEPVARVSSSAPGFKATPAVRALAHRLDVDLSVVTPSGPDGLITAADVERVQRILAEVGPMEPLRSVRRSMARSMAQAHAEVVAVTLCEDADIQAWRDPAAITLRLIRAIVAACQQEPALNAWYDGHAVGRRLLKKIDLGVAVDTREGLFVPILRDVASQSDQALLQGLKEIKAAVRERRVPPEMLRGNSFTLSNFGTFAGRYADPVVMPPTVAILGAGRAREQLLPVDGEARIHRVLPLSLSFDHRAVTGGEAARFLAAVIESLAQEA